MKKIITLLLVAVLALPAFSVGGGNEYWDGMVKCKITNLHVTGDNNYDLRVYTNAPDLLDDTTTPHNAIPWAYLNENDSNYKTYLAMLTLAFTMGYEVTLYVKETPWSPTYNDYFAHIEYMIIHK